MISQLRAMIFLMLLFTSGISNSNDIYNKTKEIFKKVFVKNSEKKVKCDLGNISETIPYKLYLIIQELKNESNDELFLNRLIFYGPPGNGKSTYARKIADVTNAVFQEVSGPSIVNTFQGSGAQNINKIFEDAILENLNTGKNVVIFIDEVDSIASKNSKRTDNKAAVQSLWLNLDKIKNNPYIFVILATNEFKNLHPTLMDRFGDNIIEIKNPDQKMREEVIEFYTKKFNLNNEKVKVKSLAKRTDGFSIRSIEDSLRSVKRLSNIENNGEPTDKIINEILSTHKTKPLFENLESKFKEFKPYLDFVNSAGGLLAITINILSIYSYFKSTMDVKNLLPTRNAAA